MPDVTICANFDVEKLRGLGYTGGGQIWGSPIEMAGHPYNSAALPRSLWLCCTAFGYLFVCLLVFSVAQSWVHGSG